MHATYRIGQEYARIRSESPVRIEHLRKRRPVDPHDHEFYEICFVWAGQGVHETEAGRMPLEPGHVIVVAPGQVHAFPRLSMLEVTNVYYLAEWFWGYRWGGGEAERLADLFFRRVLPGRVVGLPLLGKLPATARESCRRELADLHRLGEEPAVRRLLVEACFTKLLALVASEAGLDAEPSAGSPPPARVRWCRRRLEEAVSRAAAPAIAGLAAEAGVHPATLITDFRRCYGVSPLQYFQARRLHAACHRLLDSQASVTEIAHELGFTDAAHLTRRFTSAMGQTPTAYRRRFRG